VMAAKVLHHRSAEADNKEAQELIDLAIAIDPDYAHAHAWKSCILGQAWTYDWCDDRDATWQLVNDELKVAMTLDENDADMHRIQAAVHLAHDDHDGAAHHQERGLALNPNYDLIVVQQGELYTWLGLPEKGIEWVKKAMRLNPHHPERFWNHLGRAYFVARRYGEAVDAFRRISRPDQFHHAFLAACTAMQGEEDAAAAHAKNVLAADPDFSVCAYLDTLHYKLESDRAHHREALLKAGLPE